MPLTEYARAYDFKDDRSMIEDIQNATLNTKDFGLQVEHGFCDIYFSISFPLRTACLPSHGTHFFCIKLDILFLN